MRSWTIPCFALFLLTPALAGLLGLRTEAVENRVLTPFPSWTVESWLDREQYARVGDWLADALPLRPQAIALDSWIDYELLGDSPSSEVLLGRNGELFLAAALSSPCPSRELDRVVENVTHLAQTLRVGGTELFLIFSPNKAFLYPDRLPPAAARGWEPCHAKARSELRQSLRQQREFVTVDLWTEFERRQGRGRRLFARLNRHWDGYAGMLQARGLIKAIRPGLWDPRAVRWEGTEEHPAELPKRFMNLVIVQQEDSYGLERPGIETHISRESIARNGDELRPISVVSARSRGPALIPGRTVIVHDSFILRSVPFLNPYFEHIQYLDWEELESHPTQGAGLLRGAERVVIQLIEDHRSARLGSRRMGLLTALRSVTR